MKHHLTFSEKLGFIWIYLSRTSRLWVRFKLSFLFSFVSLFFTIAVFYFINLFVGEIPGYGNYFTFVLIGLVVNQFMQITLSVYLGAMHRIYWSNWLELILTSPTGTGTFFTAVMTWNYINGLFNVAFYFLIGIFVFGATFAWSSVMWLTIPIIILVITSLSGIGLISASMFLLANAKGDVEPIGWVFSTLTGLLAGVYFPPELLPGSVQVISKIFPQTYGIDAIRRVMLYGEGLSSPNIQHAILYLIIFSVVLLPLGMWMFRRGIKKAEREGTLARWM